MARVLPGGLAASGRLFLPAAAWEAMALGVSWMGWRRPDARHGRQRRGYSGRKTVFAAVSIVFEASQAVDAVLRTFGGGATAAPVVLPLAIVAARLSISGRHGTNSRGRLRLHRTCHVKVDKLPKLNFNLRLNSTKQQISIFIFFVEFDFSK